MVLVRAEEMIETAVRGTIDAVEKNVREMQRLHVASFAFQIDVQLTLTVDLLTGMIVTTKPRMMMPQCNPRPECVGTVPNVISFNVIFCMAGSATEALTAKDVRSTVIIAIEA
jgi:hypothetical protein